MNPHTLDAAGHHATRVAAIGFCFFNNVAVAVRHALDELGLRRVALIDFDAHHGNGTQDFFAGDERALMVSIFERGLYPYSTVAVEGRTCAACRSDRIHEATRCAT